MIGPRSDFVNRSGNVSIFDFCTLVWRISGGGGDRLVRSLPCVHVSRLKDRNASMPRYKNGQNSVQKDGNANSISAEQALLVNAG